MVEMKLKSDKTIQVIVNWIILLISPVIIIPWLLYDLYKTKQFVRIMIKGETSL